MFYTESITIYKETSIVKKIIKGFIHYFCSFRLLKSKKSFSGPRRKDKKSRTKRDYTY